MDNDNKQQDKKPVKGYSKRPIWQWVLIYIVVAVVVYGAIYFFFVNGGDDAGTGSLGY